MKQIKHSDYRKSSVVKGLIIQFILTVVTILVSRYYWFSNFLLVIYLMNVFKILEPVFQVEVVNRFKSTKTAKNIKIVENTEIEQEKSENISNSISSMEETQFVLNRVYKRASSTNFKRNLKNLIEIEFEEEKLSNFKNFIVNNLVKAIVKQNFNSCNFNNKISSDQILVHFNSNIKEINSAAKILEGLSNIGWAYYEKDNKEHKKLVYLVLNSFLTVISNGNNKYKNFITYDDSTNSVSLKINECLYDCFDNPLIAYFYMFSYLKKEENNYIGNFGLNRLFTRY